MRSFAVWLLEILCEAAGTTLWMAILALIQYGPDRGHYPYGYIGVLVGISAVVLIEFALTGYVVTTLLSALLISHHRRYLYPSVCFSLYLIHSEIFFLAVGNRMYEKSNLAIQLGGACLAFAITLAGDCFRQTRAGSPQTWPVPAI